MLAIAAVPIQDLTRRAQRLQLLIIVWMTGGCDGGGMEGTESRSAGVIIVPFRRDECEQTTPLPQD